MTDPRRRIVLWVILILAALLVLAREYRSGATSTAPYPSAPLCPFHYPDAFHTLWDAGIGCHFDHEHGTSPFTPEVYAAFPGMDLLALLGNVQIGHTNPSGPAENTIKHGGFKWQVDLPTARPCAVGFENATVGLSASVIQYHNFGDYAVEFEARKHSTVALLRQCLPTNPTDYGYVFIVQLQDYGQRVSQYQGAVMPYPDTPSPAYGAGLGPYFTIDRYGTCVGCRPSLAYVRANNINANSIWTSKGGRTGAQGLFNLLFRVRDTYQLKDDADTVYPFTFGFVCGGATYAPAGCRYNNSTTTVHEVAGTIPAAWDGLAGFDTDARAGRVTGEAYTTAAGTLTLTCSTPGMDCYPIKLLWAFVGSYGADLCAVKCSTTGPATNPEREICFSSGGKGLPAAGTLLDCDAPGAVPSGWIGATN